MKEVEDNYMAPWYITREEVDGINIKYISNTDDMFAVSRLGGVYSFSNKMRGKKIGSCVPSGYVTAYIKYNDGTSKLSYIHRLVAEAFIPNPEGKKQVAHINEQRDDNRADNLCWASAKENCWMGNHNKRLAASVKEYWRQRDNFGKTAKRVVIMDMNDKIVEIAPSIQAAADYIKYRTGKSDNSSSVQISAILQGKRGFRTVGGYKVAEASEEEYQKWAADHFNSLLQEEDIEISEVQLKKLNKVDGVRITNRRLNVETGEMETSETVYEAGENIVNELK